jgi:hypothetical protein
LSGEVTCGRRRVAFRNLGDDLNVQDELDFATVTGVAIRRRSGRPKRLTLQL